jgi:DNA-directed RNA polymerase alpha subunit
MDVWTDGSISPEAALKSAAKDLINSLGQIFDTQEFSDEVITIASNPGSLLADISVEEIELPLRVTNALKKAGYGNIESLTRAGRGDVSKSKNVGEKSLKVIDSWLKEKGYSWSK